MSGIRESGGFLYSDILFFLGIVSLLIPLLAAYYLRTGILLEKLEEGRDGRTTYSGETPAGEIRYLIPRSFCLTERPPAGPPEEQP